jgi:hypothetical protein
MTVCTHHRPSSNAAILLIMQEFMPAQSTCTLVCLKWYYTKMSDSESSYLWIKQVPHHHHTHTERKLLALWHYKAHECLKFAHRNFRISKTTHSLYKRTNVYKKAMYLQISSTKCFFIYVFYEKTFQSNVLLHFTKEILCHHYHYTVLHCGSI